MTINVISVGSYESTCMSEKRELGLVKIPQEPTTAVLVGEGCSFGTIIMEGRKDGPITQAAIVKVACPCGLPSDEQKSLIEALDRLCQIEKISHVYVAGTNNLDLEGTRHAVNICCWHRNEPHTFKGCVTLQ